MTDLLKRFLRRAGQNTCRCCSMPEGAGRSRLYRAAKKRERQAVREEIEAELMELGAEVEQ